MNIKEIAKKAGVSIATVSRALNQPDLVKLETKEKILKVVNKMQYVPNPFAQGLSKGKTNSIALIVPTLYNPKFTVIAEGAEAFLSPKDYTLTIFNTNESLERQESIMEYIVNKKVSGYVDGLIITGSGLFVEGYEKLERLHTPIVAIDNIVEQDSFSCIEVDDLYGIYMIFSYFKRLGHQNIGIIHGQTYLPVTIRRFKKIHELIEELKLNLNNNHIGEGLYDSFDSGYNAMQDILNSSSPPTAIYAFNDVLAIGAMRCLYDNDIRIPEDIAIIGSDGTILGKFFKPSLTTLQFPHHEIGHKAAQILLEHIQDKNKKIEKKLLKPELIIRESC